MGATEDLARIGEQERRLCFRQFGLAEAWDLGCRIRRLAEAKGIAVAIEVRLGRRTVFQSAMPGTTALNADWARRKLNSVELAERPTYAIGLDQRPGTPGLAEIAALPVRDFAAHGGGFPIRVEGSGCVGAVAVSGPPQRQDHGLVVEALAEMCGVPLAEIALE
ncbi:MAG: heme-degrading domain-containing protein [Amaricoccus sp.]